MEVAWTMVLTTEREGLKSTDVCLDVMGGKAEFLPSAIREKCVPFTEIVKTGKGSKLE